MTDYEREKDRILDFIGRRAPQREAAGGRQAKHCNQLQEPASFRGNRIGTAIGTIVVGDNSTVVIGESRNDQEQSGAGDEEEEEGEGSAAELVSFCQSLADQVEHLHEELQTTVQRLRKAVSRLVNASQTKCPRPEKPAHPCVAASRADKPVAPPAINPYHAVLVNLIPLLTAYARQIPLHMPPSQSICPVTPSAD